MGVRQKSFASQSAPVLPVRDNVHFPQLISTLLVGREMSARAVHAALGGNQHVVVVGQHDSLVEKPKPEDLFSIGTLSEVVQVMPMPDGTQRVVLRGLSRVRLDKHEMHDGHYFASFEVLLETDRDEPKDEALRRSAVEEIMAIANAGRAIPYESLEQLPEIRSNCLLADTIADLMPISTAQKQQILEELDSSVRIEKLVQLLVSERQLLDIQSEIRARVEAELGNTQREYFLREQLRVIQQQLGDEAVLSSDNEGLWDQLVASGIPEEQLARARQEILRLERLPSQSQEGGVIRSYLECLADLPWQKASNSEISVKNAEKILDSHHFGLDQIKTRILDFLAVRQLNPSIPGPILCFSGPPGVGKTSLARSIAEALGRKFIRISVGGVRDEAEIRGHRRTYIGAMPGRIMQGIRQCGECNPVILLDEVDKIALDLRGDPTSALLEALDPEQNSAFSDHYIEAPFDLSQVFFICTANVPEQIPAALRDRMEFIEFRSYTESEKLQISEDFLIPRARDSHGLKKNQLKISKKSLQSIVRLYTRESGVRQLERCIATIARKNARKIAENAEATSISNDELLQQALGKPVFSYGKKSKADEIGSVTGLAYTPFGGDILPIDVNLMPVSGAQPEILLTGYLGEVMKESAMAAVTYLRSTQLHPKNEEFRFDVHLHVPDGAIPKDGPSAGVSIATALASAHLKRPVKADVAMTGEITLRGKILAVGGIREKVIAAHRSGIRTILLPKDNERDLDEIPVEIAKEIQVHLVTHLDEVFALALA